MGLGYYGRGNEKRKINEIRDRHNRSTIGAKPNGSLTAKRKRTHSHRLDRTRIPLCCSRGHNRLVEGRQKARNDK